MKELITELKYAEFFDDQRSITRLFPDWHTKQKGVYERGGVQLYRMRPGRWEFKVRSGTTEGVRYDVVIAFSDIEELIEQFAPDESMQKKGGGVDFKKLALAIMNEVDMKFRCNDPSFKYWGYQYILTQKGAQHGEPEDRAPDIRNPKRYGTACKHIHNVMERLPFYSGTMATYLKQFYGDLIADIEKAMKKAKEEPEEEKKKPKRKERPKPKKRERPPKKEEEPEEAEEEEPEEPEEEEPEEE